MQDWILLYEFNTTVDINYSKCMHYEMSIFLNILYCIYIYDMVQKYILTSLQNNILNLNRPNLQILVCNEKIR